LTDETSLFIVESGIKHHKTKNLRNQAKLKHLIVSVLGRKHLQGFIISLIYFLFAGRHYLKKLFLV
jgi:hypothetical protein